MLKQVDVKIKSGTVVGHSVRYVPESQKRLGEGVTLTHQHNIGAFVELVVDHKLCFVRCARSTKMLDVTEHPTNEMHKEVFNTVISAHPPCSERSLSEVINPRNKKNKRYIFTDQG